MAKAKLTPDDETEARRRYALGTRLKDLATQFDVSTSTMRRVLKNGPDNEELPERPTKREPSALTPEQANEVWRQREAGTTYQTIATNFNVSLNTVRRTLERLETQPEEPNPEDGPRRDATQGLNRYLEDRNTRNSPDVAQGLRTALDQAREELDYYTAHTRYFRDRYRALASRTRRAPSGMRE